MRRIIVNSKSALNPLEQLKLDYQAFKTLHPEAYARAPLEIKLLAKAANEAGFSVRQISESIGLAIPSIYAWFHSLEKKKAKSLPTKRDQLASQQILNKATLPVKSYDLNSFKQLIQNFQVAEGHDKEYCLSELGKHVKELLATETYTIESLAKVAGAHPLSIRAWMKAPAVNKVETNTEFLGDDHLSKQAAVVAENAESVSKEIPPGDESWVRVRVGTHVMELAWEDLLQRLPLRDMAASLASAKLAPSIQEKNLDQSIYSIAEEASYDELMEGFERCIIQRALQRHHSIALAAASLQLSRSTFDNRRRKLGLLGKEQV